MNASCDAMTKEKLMKLSPGKLTDLGICPTCFNQENSSAHSPFGIYRLAQQVVRTPEGGAMGALPVADKATRASGSGRCATQPRRRQGAHRAPQQGVLIKVTLRPAAAGNARPRCI